MRVIAIGERPAYICNLTAGPVQAVYADAAQRVERLDADAATRLVTANAADPVDAIRLVEYDQWIVHQRFDSLRPLWRAELLDDKGTHLYVSSRTGEIVQRTHRTQRFMNYFGAVAHWIYPTVLRKHWALWDQVVWYLALFSAVCAISGVYLGVSRWVEVRRTGRGVLSRFRGWLRWHHVLGLFFGVLVVSWIVSGWLSMDHGRLFSVPTPTAEQLSALRGVSLREATGSVSTVRLSSYRSARELTIHAFGGRAVIVARNEHGALGAPALVPESVASVVESAFPHVPVASYGTVPAGDTYTSLREGGLPTGAIRVVLDDPGETWLHIDNRSGEILSVIDRSRRVYRWAFNGLHSLDIPGLVDRRPLWDAVMLTLLIAGLAVSGTGVVIGFRRAIRMMSR